MSTEKFTITPQQSRELTDLAGMLYAEAGRCLEANCWAAALILISGSAEAALLATVCVFEPELREKGLWKPPREDPTKWTLSQVADVARRAGWLPSVLPAATGEMFTSLRFVERARNMAVHPGAYVRETLRPDLEDEQHMRLTYELIDGIVAVVFEHLTTQMNTLGVLSESASFSTEQAEPRAD